MTDQPDINLPDWLRHLRTVPEAESGIHYYTDEEIRAARAKFDEDGDGHLELYGKIHVPSEVDLRGQAVEVMTKCVKVGEGVEGGRFSVLNRIMRSDLSFRAEFWFDPSSPDGLLCSLNRDCPPHLWFPVGRTLESVTAALAIYFTDLPADPAEGPATYAARLRNAATTRAVPSEWHTARMLLGVVEEMREIENALVFRSAFCRSFDALATAGSGRRVGVTSFNTLNSFSRVVLEHHHWLEYAIGKNRTGSPVVAEITYPPAAHADLIRVYNNALDTDVPLDVPVDVVGALFGYPIKGLPRLHSALNQERDPGGITYVMGFLVATEGDDAALVAELQKFSTHASPQVRTKVARHAHIRQQDDLVRQMLDREQDPNVRQALEGMLAPPAAE
jgi:hypothetical protein